MGSERTYIAIARNAASGDPAMYAVLDWTVEARDKQEAAKLVREAHPGIHFAIMPARHFTEFAPVQETDRG